MLDIRGLRKTFNAGTPNEVRSLRGIDLSIPEGMFLVVIGSNGSGKSTLLNAVAGSFLPDEGSLHIAGQDVTRWPEHRRARLVGRVFQNPFSGTAPTLSIAQNLSLASRRGMRRVLGLAQCGEQRPDMLSRVRSLGMALEERLDNAIGSLSGGQRQALTLLMATWLKPSLLLLDEHTAALDPRSAEQVMRITQQVVSRDRLTTLMVTHSMQHAVTYGDRLVMMHRGQVIHDFEGAEKRRLRPADLLARFEEVRRADLLDETAADLLRRRYV
ncbi:MAG: ABC transporter ATP-binding protein [Steroidobacteraceae bacterium]